MKSRMEYVCRPSRLRSGLVALFASLAALGFSCAERSRGWSLSSSERLVGSIVPIQSTLDGLWEAHGALDKWRNFRSVSLRFSVHGDPPGLEFPRQRISFRLDDWNLLTVGEGSAEELVDLAHFLPRNADEEAFDYYTRTARMCFHLPFSIAHPDWELRRDIVEALVEEEPYGFWAIPLGIPSPHLAYYLLPDHKTGLLKTAYYQVGHPRFAGKVFAADFRRYRRIGGLMVATEIAHRLVGESDKSGQQKKRPDDPFDTTTASFKSARLADGSFDVPSAPLLWILRYDGITFK